MTSKNENFNSKQLLFKELFVGTLLYAVILGLFNDYTSIVYAKSFSTILFAATILELLTCLVFSLKNKIVTWLKDRPGMLYKSLMFFCVWLVMFISKFIFVWVIDMVFGEYMNINGFFGILAIVLSVTIIHKLADTVFRSLGNGVE